MTEHNHEHQHKDNHDRNGSDNHGHGHSGHHGHQHDYDAHDHGHGHNHSETDLQSAVSITEHEGALVASITLTYDGDYQKTKQNLSNGLAKLANWVNEVGGVIGHIKGSLIGEQTVTTFSTTGGPVNVSSVDSSENRIEAVAIVFNVDKQELAQQLLALKTNLT
ncbi:hypothetical protein FACS1894104_4890 [Actinomycetota bacterium]|nr:hypothetical protein FACS1894104_4890 [Actinomycetota bacterium]